MSNELLPHEFDALRDMAEQMLDKLVAQHMEECPKDDPEQVRATILKEWQMMVKPC